MATYGKSKAKSGQRDLMAEIRQRFARCSDAEEKDRKLMLEDIRFSIGNSDNGYQWPQVVKQQRETDPLAPRPCLTINKVSQHVHQVLNDIRLNPPSIKARPVDMEGDEEVAQAIGKFMHAIEEQSSANIAYMAAADTQVRGAWGYARVVTEYENGNDGPQVIRIKPIFNPFSVYMDEKAYMPDGSDASYVFITEEFRRDDFEEKWPNAKPVSWDDARGDSAWYPDKDKLVVAEYLCKKRENGKTVIHWYKCNGSEILEEGIIPGEHIPVARAMGEQVFAGTECHRSGMVRNPKDPQRMYNYWASAGTEMIALAPKAPFIGAVGQFENFENKWEQANIRNFAYLEYNPISIDGVPMPPPQRQPPAPVNAAIIQEKLAANDDIKATMGMYDASLGQRSNETSGKAIMARQREGDVGTYHYAANLGLMVRQVGRIILSMLPHVYDTRRIVELLGEDGQSQLAVFDPASPQPVQDLVSEQAGLIKKIFNPTIGKYDVTITTGPSFTTRRQEASESMIDFVRAVPGAGAITGDLIAKNQDWPGADDFAKRLRKALPPQLVEEEEGRMPVPPQVKAQLAQLSQAVQLLQQQNQELMLKASENEVKKMELKGKSEEMDFKKDELNFKREELAAKSIEGMGLTVTSLIGNAVASGVAPLAAQHATLAQAAERINEQVSALAQYIAAPKVPIYGPSGQIVAVEVTGFGRREVVRQNGLIRSIN